MGKKAKIHPDWATKYREKGKEVRLINGRYYLYSYSYKYDPERKRSVKVTGKLLGRITEEDGFIPSEKRSLVPAVNIKCREYGLSQFILNQKTIIERLRCYFPDKWKAILLMSYSRIKHCSPIKRMNDDFENSMLSEKLNFLLNKKAIPNILQSIGKDEFARSEYMKSFIHGKDFLLIDSTFLRTSMRKSSLAKGGYNKDHFWETQASLLYIYSKKLQQPVYYRLLAGNIRDVKALSLTIQESEIGDATIIADKGFYSESNVKDLIENKLSFVIPLRRNSSLIDYDGIETSRNVIEYNKTYLRYKKYKIGNGFIYLFRDPFLAGEEENNLVSLTISHPEKYNLTDVDLKKVRLGTVAFFSNLDSSAEEIYTLYKMRLSIEQSFDTLKTVLKADASYMSDDDKFQGWMFVNHIAIQWSYEILKTIKKHKLSTSISLEDAIRRLSEIKKVRLGDSWYLAEQTKAELKIAELLLT
ncbi:MAG: transposase [Bdellovibrionota bacterium]|jgi:transposase